MTLVRVAPKKNPRSSRSTHTAKLYCNFIFFDNETQKTKLFTKSGKRLKVNAVFRLNMKSSGSNLTHLNK